MRKVKEILRLSLKEGLSQREVAQSTGVGKTTVQELLGRVKEKGYGWEKLSEMREYQILEEVIYPPASSSSAKELPDWAEVRKQLLQKGNTLALLWSDYKDTHPTGLSYSRFCDRYKDWQKKSRLTLRQNHIAEEKLFVDFSGLTVPWTDLKTGEVYKAEIFVAVLGASNKTFVKAFPDQSLKSWIEAHIDSFQFFKGVPKAVVPDNLKAGVSRACRYDPEKNPSYLSLAEHYGTAILPTRAYKPKDKAKVEVGVQIAQRWILAILRRKIFTSIYQINAEISALLELMNNKVMKHLQVSRNELFEKFEKPMLKELPPSSFEMPSWKEAKVNIDYHIEFSKHYYSVPFRYVGQQVRIKVTRSLVEIFYKDEIIATHKKEEHLIKRYTTLSQHMPPQHQEHVKWTPERILEWAQKSGPSTRKLCEVVISKQAHPEQAFRACLGILRLGNKFGEDRLESASTLALHIGNCYYRTIETILKSGKDKVGVQVLKRTDCKIPIHENIRGSSYYN